MTWIETSARFKMKNPFQNADFACDISALPCFIADRLSNKPMR
jgi:hypothetical protein